MNKELAEALEILKSKPVEKEEGAYDIYFKRHNEVLQELGETLYNEAYGMTSEELADKDYWTLWQERDTYIRAKEFVRAYEIGHAAGIEYALTPRPIEEAPADTFLQIYSIVTQAGSPPTKFWLNKGTYKKEQITFPDAYWLPEPNPTP